jgi:hypothetical protein
MTVEHNKRGGKGSCSREDAPQEASAKRRRRNSQQRTKEQKAPNEIEGRDDVITYGPNLSPNLGFLNSSFLLFY